MTNPSYAELHCHSYYSFHDGASSLEELLLRAKELGYQALALTEHNNLCGAMRFAQLAQSLEIQGIIGVELNSFYPKLRIPLNLLYERDLKSRKSLPSLETETQTKLKLRKPSHPSGQGPPGLPQPLPSITAAHASGERDTPNWPRTLKEHASS
jgi:DNA polymerase III alpha subunit